MVGRQVLRGHPWVWLGDDFARADAVAFKCTLNARPLLSAVPGELAAFGKLLRALGVRETFAASDYRRALGALAEQLGGAPLPTEKLDIAVAMVQFVADDSGGAAGDAEEKMMVPDQDAILASAGDLAYNDAPWMGAAAFGEEEHRFVHPNISIEVGSRVGCRSLRQQLLLRTSDVIDLGLQDAEAFGQSESLTGRLRHILELYPDGPQILSELIQNADDARASEVRFPVLLTIAVTLCTAW